MRSVTLDVLLKQVTLSAAVEESVQPSPRRPPFGPDASLSDDAILGRCARTLL
jgi:hypothetical protein